MTRWGLAAAWVLAAATATTLTWQVVSSADERVSDRPLAAIEVDSGAALPGSGATTGGGPVPSPDPTDGATTSTTTVSASPAPTSTTSTSSPGTGAESWKVETVATPGGTVVLGYRPGEVRLESASPAVGFAVEVKKEGPPVVEVELTGPLSKVVLEAGWAGGLSVDVGTD